MLTVRVYDDYNLIALQDLDTDNFVRCDFSKKIRAETTGMCRTLKSSKLLENPVTSVKKIDFISSIVSFVKLRKDMRTKTLGK